MPRFAYNAVGSDGSFEKGEIEADTDAIALDQLAQRGLTPFALKSGSLAAPWWNRDLTFGSSSGEIKSSELENLFTSLAALLKAQFPLRRSLRFCLEEAKDTKLRQAMERIVSKVEDGQPLGKAMDALEGAFPKRLIEIVSIGEKSNQMEVTMANAAALLSNEAAHKRRLRAALIYPVILLVMAVIVLAIVVFYLAPTLMPVFVSAGVDAPLTLRVMKQFGDVFLLGWPVILGLGLGLFAMVLVFRAQIASRLQSVIRRIPLLGNYSKQRETLELARTLHLMLSSGAMLPKALKVAADAAQNPTYAALLQDAQIRIAEGGTLADTLSESPLIDRMSGALIKAGEESDRLPETLQSIVEELAARTTRTMQQLIRMVTPVLTLIIGIGVGAVILSTITAIMDLNDIAL